MSCYRIIYCLLVCVCVLNAASCQRNDSDTTEILGKVAQIVESHPDSALLLLDSITIPHDLNKEEYNKYLLLQIQSKDKLYKDITKDTLIFQVKDYYVRKKDLVNVALSTFYCGRVRHEQKNWEAAITEYMETNTCAEEIGDINLRALSQSHIGEVFFNKLLPEQAIEHFEIAAQYFHEIQNVKNEIITYGQIGNVYLTMAVNDSAFYYYNKGLGLAKVNNDSLRIAWLMQDISIAYRETGKYDLAEKYIRNASKYATDDKNRIKQYLNLSKIYYKRELPDSAKMYVDKSLSLLSENGDIYTAADIYKTLSLISEKHSDFKQSLDYYKEYARNIGKIASENKSKEILELREKYDNERLKNENNRLEAKSQRVYLFLSVTLLVICLIALFFYRKAGRKSQEVLKKENELLEKNNELLEAKSRIYQLLEMAENYNNKADSDRNLLLYHFGILKKVSLLRQYLREDDELSQRLIKRLNKIVYGQESMNWDIFYRDMNNIHNGLFNRLKERYPVLDEDEFRICCMAYADFTCSETGIIMGLSAHTVEMKRSSIRKKLGIEPKGSIQNYLNTLSSL